MKNKNKLLDKIIKKNYNNELEEVLSNKPYAEEVKNLLLDILYKIENAYDDYETVKVNVLPKEEYIQNIINVIKNNCYNIKLMTQNLEENPENRTFFIDYENKEITCYPIERKLLYALSKIQKKDNIVQTDDELLNKAFTDLLNVGNNINMVEPFRDFNGFSWNISTLEIENLYFNMIYQDLIILIGNAFLEEWINKNEDPIIDYMTLFQSELEKKYENKVAKEILRLLKKLAILLELSTNTDIRKEIEIKKTDVQEELEDMQNKEHYLENVCKEKKRIEKQIKKIDIVINNKKLLLEEYERRNENLPLGEKIFSTRVLANQLKKERDMKLERINEYNILINPKNFRIVHNRLKEQYEYLCMVDEKNLEDKILEELVNLQKEVLRCFKSKIANCTNKSEFIKIMHEFRYFYLIPLSADEDLGTVAKLSKLKNIVAREFLKKANELKIISKIFKEEKRDSEILKKVYSLKIISLEDVYFQISKTNDAYYLEFYDENIADERFVINLDLKKEDFQIKLNKKIKLFI